MWISVMWYEVTMKLQVRTHSESVAQSLRATNSFSFVHTNTRQFKILLPPFGSPWYWWSHYKGSITSGLGSDQIPLLSVWTGLAMVLGPRSLPWSWWLCKSLSESPRSLGDSPALVVQVPRWKRSQNHRVAPSCSIRGVPCILEQTVCCTHGSKASVVFIS